MGAVGPRDVVIAAQACCWTLQNRPDVLLARPDKMVWGLRFWHDSTSKQHYALLSVQGVLLLSRLCRPTAFVTDGQYELLDLANALAARLPIMQDGDRMIFKTAATDPCGACCLLLPLDAMSWSLAAGMVRSIEHVDLGQVDVGKHPVPSVDEPLPTALSLYGPGPAAPSAEEFYHSLLPLPPSSQAPAAGDLRRTLLRYLIRCRLREQQRLQLAGQQLPEWLVDATAIDEATLTALLPLAIAGRAAAAREAASAAAAEPTAVPPAVDTRTVAAAAVAAESGQRKVIARGRPDRVAAVRRSAKKSLAAVSPVEAAAKQMGPQTGQQAQHSPPSAVPVDDPFANDEADPFSA